MTPCRASVERIRPLVTATANVTGGPRHLEVDQNSGLMYALGELENKLSVIEINKDTGKPRVVKEREYIIRLAISFSTIT